MKQYKQLTSELRYQIYGLKQAGLNQTEIAKKIGVDKGTISREFKRNEGKRGWRPKQAQSFRDERRQACTNGKCFSSDEWAEVERLIREDLSPEQAANRLALEGCLQISHEIIYQHIYADKRNGGELHQHLRSQKPRRKRYASGQERRGTIKNRVSIDERPEIVAEKTRMGDWEGDTVIGKNHKGGLVTLAERKSRYVLAGHIRSKHAAGVTAVTTRLLTPHKDKCHTITFDNGKEFAEHEKMAAELKADIYFANPYHSWERGLNENSNGLLRQYFPKGMELTDITEEQVQEAVERINHRPRKALGFRTPHEVFFGVEVRYTKQPLVVALLT
ncbi:MAG: IS30 family transposase [Hydrogenophilales bacterium CG_4_8_14_3_um_filter_62_83]|nr:MAG: IS30 family transposase [Hydrogenophilales bacterium CG15_BIG_FIL_POST_REV_8_21_14_020_62_31]PIX02769.1 MAG: IS30 family transposase [Hydrogenophilales bacterium CG_4_8_14_3_um_filter_62_83]PIY98985.1 MAG: IS30 family transposase [Hydrogenophilales bacterium CG_4_10_14_0_8_um_filter_62_70]